jgi:hypothetical protein
MLRRVFAYLLFGVAACAGASHGAPDRHVILCDHGKCPYAHTCRYRQVEGRQVSECRLEVGRCYSDWDCAPSAQSCQRFNADPGTCVMTGL